MIHVASPFKSVRGHMRTHVLIKSFVPLSMNRLILVVIRFVIYFLSPLLIINIMKCTS